MPMRFRFLKQQEPRKRERQLAFNRAQRFHEKFKRQFAARFLAIADDIESRITDELVKAAAEAQSAEAIIRAIPIGVYEPLAKQGIDELTHLPFDDLLDTLLADLLREKAELEVSILLDKLKAGPLASRAVGFQFNIVNPNTTAWLRTHRLELIREIKAGTEKAIRDIVTSGIEEGINPVSMARQIRETIGLTTKQAKTIAKLRSSLEAQGLPKFQVKNLVRAARRRKINQRAKLIARTEITRAESQGQMDAWRQSIDDGLLDSSVLKNWVAGGTADPICRALHNAKPVQMDAAFMTGFGDFFAPPAHPGCRCTLILVRPEDLTEAEAAA